MIRFWYNLGFKYATNENEVKDKLCTDETSSNNAIPITF